MLLSAKFENIYSFNEETRILFTASKSDQLPLQVSRAEKRDDISVLRMGLIYGANASGKSFPEQFKIFEDFFFRKRKKCFLKISFFILFTVYIAAADSGDGAAIWGKQSFDLIDFLFDHKNSFLSLPDSVLLNSSGRWKASA